MKTLDLRQRSVDVRELLAWALTESVLIRSEDGHEFILESADDFDREVAELGNSDTFMRFLAERATEYDVVDLDDLVA